MARLALRILRLAVVTVLGIAGSSALELPASTPAAPGRAVLTRPGVSERPAALYALDAPAISRPVAPLASPPADRVDVVPGQPVSGSLTSYEGITRTLAATRTPDIAGEIGPDVFVQVGAGASFAVFDRAGAILAGPALLRDLWPQGSCHDEGASHASVVWDPESGRWFLSYAGHANTICIAISMTPDPRGAYHLYTFYAGVAAESVDLGIWPDVLLLSIPHPQSWIFALEKAKMVNGEPARAVGGYGPESGAGHPIPVSFSGGPLPPSGAFPLFLSRISPRAGLPSGRFALSRINVGGWLPGHGSIGEIWSGFGSDLGVAADLSCEAPGPGCIPQPGILTQLWASDPPIRAIARYRRFDAVQRIVAAVSVATGAPAKSQVVWLKLSAEWPQNTWALDAHGAGLDGSESRWLGAAAINSAAEIGLAYSVSSAVITPSLRYALWASTEISGAAASEAVFWPGAGVQSVDGTWNDRASLSIDPADGCAFWTTGVYLDGASVWRSRIGRFQSLECVPVTYALRLLPDRVDVCADTPHPFSASAITLSASSLISLSAVSITPTLGLTAEFASPPVALAMPITLAFTVTYPMSGPSGQTLLGLRGEGSGLFTATAEVTVWKPITSAPALSPAVVDRAPRGLTPSAPGITQSGMITYELAFAWSAAQNARSYLLEVATDAGFSSVVLSRTTQATLEQARVSLTPLTNYHWRVRAENACGSILSSSGGFRTFGFVWLPVMRR